MDKSKKFLYGAILSFLIGFGLLAMAFDAYSSVGRYSELIEAEIYSMETATDDTEREENLFFIEENQKRAGEKEMMMYLYGAMGVVFLIIGGVIFARRK